MRKISLFLFQVLAIVFAQAQTETLTQTVKGTVPISPVSGVLISVSPNCKSSILISLVPIIK